MTKNQTKSNKPFIEYQSSGYDTTQTMDGYFFRDNSMEKWKQVLGFEGLYVISDCGNLKTYRNTVRGRILLFKTPQKNMSICNDQNGYEIVRLWKNKKAYSRRIHRLVLETFVGKCPKGMECCHKDNNKKNNKLHNLTWDTHRNNQVRDGGGRSIIGQGQDNPMAKFTTEQVLEIKTLKKRGMRTKDIARIVGLQYEQIRKIATGRTWRHITV